MRRVYHQARNIMRKILLRINPSFGVLKKRYVENNLIGIHRLKNKFNNESCFIIGNSSSIKNYNLEALKNYKLFFVNRGFDLCDYGFCYVASDPGAREAYGSEIDYSKFEYIFTSSHFGEGPLKGNHYIYDIFNWPRIINNKFQDNIEMPLYPGSTVVLEALQIAVYLGFKNIYFLGVDLNFNSSSSSHFYKLSTRENQRRQKVSITGQEEMKESFKFSCKYLKERGVNIYNASSYGDLDQIPRISIEHLL